MYVRMCRFLIIILCTIVISVYKFYQYVETFASITTSTSLSTSKCKLYKLVSNILCMYVMKRIMNEEFLHEFFVAQLLNMKYLLTSNPSLVEVQIQA